MSNEKKAALDEIEYCIIRQAMSAGIWWSDIEFEKMVLERIVEPENRMMQAVHKLGYPHIVPGMAIERAIIKFQEVDNILVFQRFCKRNKGGNLKWASTSMGIVPGELLNLGRRCSELGLGEDFSKWMDGTVSYADYDFPMGNGCYRVSGSAKTPV